MVHKVHTKLSCLFIHISTCTSVFDVTLLQFKVSDILGMMVFKFMKPYFIYNVIRTNTFDGCSYVQHLTIYVMHTMLVMDRLHILYNLREPSLSIIVIYFLLYSKWLQLYYRE